MTDCKQSEMSTTLLAILKEENYIIRPSKTCVQDKGWNANQHSFGERSPDWNCANTERGVRLAVVQRDSWAVHVQAKLRTEIGSFKVAGTGELRMTNGEDLVQVAAPAPSNSFGQYRQQKVLDLDNKRDRGNPEVLFNWLRRLRGQDATKKLRSKADLEPLNFGGEILPFGAYGHVFIKHFLAVVRCVDIVTINSKLQVTQQGIEAPGEKCWFLVTGSARGSGHEVKLIVNSDITRFHPLVNRNTEKFKGLQVTNNVRPGFGKIDYTTFTVLDQQAVRLAIEMYLESHSITQ